MLGGGGDLFTVTRNEKETPQQKKKKDKPLKKKTGGRCRGFTVLGKKNRVVWGKGNSCIATCHGW